MKFRRRKSPVRTAKRLPASAFPILEYDPSPTAIIEPRRVYKSIDIPKHCVLCFFQDVIDDLVLNGGAREIDHAISEAGRHPVYESRSTAGGWQSCIRASVPRWPPRCSIE